MSDSLTASKHKYAISKETIQDNSSHTLRVGVDRQTGETVALALFPRGWLVSTALESALVRCIDYHHPHIATLRDVFVTDSDLVAVFDYAGRESLQNFVMEQNGLSEDDARYVFQQLVVSVDYQLRMGAPSRGIHMDDVFIERASGKIRLSVFRVLKAEEPVQFGMAGPQNSRAPAVPSVPRNAVPMKRTGSPGLNSLWRTSSPGLTPPPVMDKSRTRDLGEMLYFLLHARFQHPHVYGRDGSPVSHSELDGREPQVKLSSSCNDLLKKLLARDKLTVAEIMKQPWFLVDFPKGLKEMNSYCLKMKLSPEGRQQKVQRLRKVMSTARSVPVPAEGFPPAPLGYPPASTASSPSSASGQALPHSNGTTPHPSHTNGSAAGASRGMTRPSSEPALDLYGRQPPDLPAQRSLDSPGVPSYPQGIPQQLHHPPRPLQPAARLSGEHRANSASSEDLLHYPRSSGEASGDPSGVRPLPQQQPQAGPPSQSEGYCSRSTEDVKVNMANRPLMAAMQNLRLGGGQVRKSRSNDDIAQSAPAQAAEGAQMPMTASLKPPLQRWVNEGHRGSSSLRPDQDQAWHQSAA